MVLFQQKAMLIIIGMENEVATDEWQSEYNVTIKKDGIAISEYGNGEEGTWKIKDGNLENMGIRKYRLLV